MTKLVLTDENVTAAEMINSQHRRIDSNSDYGNLRDGRVEVQ